MNGSEQVHLREKRGSNYGPFSHFSLCNISPDRLFVGMEKVSCFERFERGLFIVSSYFCLGVVVPFEHSTAELVLVDKVACFVLFQLKSTNES